MDVPCTPTTLPGMAEQLTLPSTPSRKKWTEDEDNRLRALKSAGCKKWEEISEQFPGKTGNACRKRHTRLRSADAKRNGSCFDSSILDGENQRLFKERYFQTRIHFFTYLGGTVGLDWAQAEAALQEYLPKWRDEQIEAQVSQQTVAYAQSLIQMSASGNIHPNITLNDSQMLDAP